ncbi:hypothetical protein ACQVVZ_18385 [Bacillus pretiosus]|nr:hypothetical protein [Bacillus sp. LS15-K4]
MSILKICTLEFMVILFYLRSGAGRRRKVSNECTYVALFAFGVNSSKRYVEIF